MQEVFLRAYRGLEKFRGDAQLSTWMYRLAVNAALSYATRTQARQKRDLGEEALMALPAEDAPATDPRLRARLEKALAALPAGYRAVLVLHDVEGLQHEEIADDPRLPRGHVEVAAAQGARQDARAARRCAMSPSSAAAPSSKLSALVDGDLSARAGRASCARTSTAAPGCRGALADLETMKRGLVALPERAGEDNWSVIVNRLAQPPRRGARSPRRAVVRAVALIVPALAVLALGAGGGAWLRWHKGRGLSADVVIAQAESEFHQADEHYRRAVDELRTRRREAAARTGRCPSAPSTTRRRRSSRRRWRAAARSPAAQPADVDAEELLFAAYRKEIRFYEDQMMREPQ